MSALVAHRVVPALLPAVVPTTGGSAVVGTCRPVVGPRCGVVGLAAPGAKVASGPHTPSIAQQDRIASPSGEQPGSASKVDDNPGGVEYHPADTTTQRSGKHVCRVDLVTRRCF